MQHACVILKSSLAGLREVWAAVIKVNVFDLDVALAVFVKSVPRYEVLGGDDSLWCDVSFVIVTAWYNGWTITVTQSNKK